MSRARIAAVDVARGVAILGMFGYHLTWDLAHFGFVDPRAPFSPGFRLYSHVVACAFVGLAGVSLVLARRDAFDWRRWSLHLGKIVAAAAAVSLASWFLFPEGLIFFGILHCIAAALVVATPFLVLPWSAAVVAGAAVAALPLLVQSPTFDHPALMWTGLGTYEPNSNDIRTFFPWAAPAFFGAALAMVGVSRGWPAFLSRWDARDPLSRALAFGGRHSLAIYLVHQPVFFAALSGLALVIAPATPADRAFAGQCESRCETSGAPGGVCEKACGCAAREMKRLNLWDKLVADRLDSAETKILSSVAQQCLRAQPSP